MCECVYIHACGLESGLHLERVDESIPFNSPLPFLTFYVLVLEKGVKSSKSFPRYYIQLMPPHGVLLCYKLLLLVVQ